jgi:hypothetical protein
VLPARGAPRKAPHGAFVASCDQRGTRSIGLKEGNGAIKMDADITSFPCANALWLQLQPVA